jgi:hypothetical protein
LSEFLHEEQCIVTQAVMEHQANVSASVSVIYVTQGRNKGRDMCFIQCFSCKAFGHIVPRSFVTTTRNRVISSLFVPFNLNVSRVTFNAMIL